MLAQGCEPEEKGNQQVFEALKTRNGASPLIMKWSLSLDYKEGMK